MLDVGWLRLAMGSGWDVGSYVRDDVDSYG